ncbi:putative glutathione oxidoreductase Glr1 [Calycina marina]|uniref:Glutathione reductase n=1 Tax=Calycina marina TaxID=1763456 RepID=A0A9P7Z579_9HELO|nr:putative glutathione oxidoreductase Glr1 [Calycina marina]
MTPKPKKYDYNVIGGGSGTARRSSGWYGAKTLLVEDGRSGGTCVNVGGSKHYGFATPDNITFDFAAFKKKHDEHITGLNSIYENNWSREAIDVEGTQFGMTSDGFFGIEELPKKIAIVGAGYVAVEKAGMLNALGVEVHLFVRGDTFLRSFHPMIQKVMTQRYEDAGVVVHKNFGAIGKVQLVSDGKGDDKVLKITVGGEDLEFNELLWAISRAPDIKKLNLGVTGYQNTIAGSIYALGDVTVAIAAGRQLGNRLFGSPDLAQSYLSYSDVPSVVFSHPEVGTIGLTEPQAISKYGESKVKAYHTKFKNLFYVPSIFPAEEKKNPTEFKIVSEGPEEKVVGLHLLGLGVGEMLQGFSVAVKMGARKKDFDTCVAIHPTSAEEIVTMR